jgi:hypothetical protein
MDRLNKIVLTLCAVILAACGGGIDEECYESPVKGSSQKVLVCVSDVKNGK